MLAACIVAFLLPSANVARAAPANEVQTIAITRVFPSPGQIALVIANADGSDERPLLSAGELDYDAVWSPAGNEIVFTSERGGSADLYRVNPDGSGLQRLTDHPAYDDQAAFSPDGKQLVFVSTRDGGVAKLFILDIATKQTRALTSGAGGDFRPAWSPDGKWIAFSSVREGAAPFSHGRWERLQLADIFVVRSDGTGLKRLTPHGNFYGSPKWARDGQHLLAYTMTAEQTLANRRPSPEPGNDTRLVTIEIASGAETEVSAGAGVKFNPAYVGDRVVFLRKDVHGIGTGVYYSDGTRGPKGDVRAASWSPDGKRVVFHKRVSTKTPVWAKTFSRHPGFELVLTTMLPSFNPAGDRMVAGGRPTNGVFGSSVVVAAPGSDHFETVYRDEKRNVLGPQWSPDGGSILFSVGEFAAFFNGFHSQFLKQSDRAEGGAQVALIRPDGTGYRELTTGPNNNGFASMAPDGKRFVFRTFGPDGDGLRIMDMETKAVTKLTDGYDNFPLWSPRGDLIMFSRQDEGAYEIYTIHPDATGVKRLTFTRGNDAHMGWSPDGERIVFASSRMGYKDEVTYTDAPQPYGDIFVMRFDGTAVQQLTDNQWEEGTPAWQPKREVRVAVAR
jgi:TolB protein